MPEFDDSVIAAAAPEEVWKLLYDPSRFPQWWAGVGSVDSRTDAGFTLYPEGYPDFPMPQLVSSDPAGRTVTISCLVSDLRFEWRLRPVAGGTEISAHVVIPPAEAHRLAAQTATISASLHRLATLAAESE
ncbi:MULTISPECIES: SRPBCC family protein [Streptacidiphilus]|uniref:SRPBCC family protein n=2 Tax=Streptacidiphilus TaxID=228398 RepID=A0ABV6V0Q0_9ACTN|nr:SRPBCC family protein [Streptacidiphilus jeojiense]